MTTPWDLRDSHGDAGDFHRRDPDPGRTAIFHSVERPTLVLGSAQPAERVNHRVAQALGIDVVHRRSGGGGVLLVPGEFVWLDVVLPAGDPLWVDDVGRAMVWLGECWRSALASLGVARGEVHTARLVSPPFARDVCFLSLGAGEVTVGPRKLVGISQRRTRHWARLQSMVHLRWRPELVAALVAGGAGERPDPVALAAAVDTIAAPAATIRAALVAALP